MKVALLFATFLSVMIAPVRAEPAAIKTEPAAPGAQAPAIANQCADEATVRKAAVDLEAEQVFPLLSRSGHQFIVLVFSTGEGLVVSKNKNGCFDSMLAMSKEYMEHLLTHSQPG